mgnify:CR=1 FL=1
MNIEATSLYLRILHSLAINFQFPLDVEELYTTVEAMDSKCKEILMKEHLSEHMIAHILGKVKQKLNKMESHWE